MGGFKFEDYRQPWETGPHWELKREFMEKYSDTFAEDRLLCLAQAYSNIVLMNCSYPDPVMRQISLLAEPLQMRKKFHTSTDTSEEKTAQNQDQRGAKMKAIYQKSGRPFKQIKFCSSKESQADEQEPQESRISSVNLSQETTSMLSSVSIQQQPKIISSAKENKSIDEAKSDEIKMIGNSDKKLYDEIVGCLGIEFIQNFAQKVKTLMVKENSPLPSILNAAQNLKIREFINFKTYLKPNSSQHAPIYCCEFTLKNCLISSEEANNKKTARAKSAKAAADLLMKLASDVSFLFKHKNAVQSEVQNRSVDIAEEPMVNISQGNCSKQVDFNEIHKGEIEILQKLFENVRPASNPFVSLNRASKKVMPGKCLVVNQSVCSHTSQYVYKLFFNGILISSLSTDEKRKHNIDLGQIALRKLKDLSNYEIQNGELKKKITNQLDKIELVTNINCDTEAQSKSVSEVQKLPFVLNSSMFNLSMQDEFVLVNNLVSIFCLKNARTVLSDSASFCHKELRYNFDFLPEGHVHKAEIFIGDMAVASGMSLFKESAKSSASSSSLEILRKRYYTLQVNPLQADSSISRNQVYDSGAFSSGALTDSNIGCKMLKSMGWSGGGLGTSGIAEPVGIDAQHNFKKGLGFATGAGGEDYSVFKRRINSLLQDLSNSNSLDDLLFSKEFSKEERKHIHQIARKYKLHTVSRGLGDERFLVVRRKYSIREILSHLMKVGGSDRKFQLLDASTDDLNPFVFTEST